MSEIQKIFLTSSLTIIGGVTVYVLGQIISKFLIDPIHGQNKIRGQIADALIFYANLYSNPAQVRNEKYEEAFGRFRQLATLLQSKTHLIPWYNFLEKIKIVLNSGAVQEASGELFGLSNSMYLPYGDTEGHALGKENRERAKKIRELLRLKIG